MGRKAIALLLLVGMVVLLAGCGVAVPDIKGMTVTQATAAVNSAGFKIGSVMYDEKSEGATGAVIAQDPAGGASAKTGTLVLVTVAGPPPVATPDLSGLDKGKAEAALIAGGLKPGDITQDYSAVDPGKVASQVPSAGVNAARGSAVAFVISMGQQPVAVPQAKGKSQAEATALLETAGFRVKVERQASGLKKGLVTAQTPARADAQPGSTVVISVSTGIRMVVVPDMLAWYAANQGDIYEQGYARDIAIGAANTLARYGLKSDFQVQLGETGTDRQWPSPGSSVPKGTMIHVRVYIQG